MRDGEVTYEKLGSFYEKRGTTSRSGLPNYEKLGT
jgi:hypothetical protein